VASATFEVIVSVGILLLQIVSFCGATTGWGLIVMTTSTGAPIHVCPKIRNNCKGDCSLCTCKITIPVIEQVIGINPILRHTISSGKSNSGRIAHCSDIITGWDNTSNILS
jgi:hypothetical protein